MVADPQLLGGKLAIRGTRLSVSLILECLAGGISLEDIDQAFDRAIGLAEDDAVRRFLLERRG